MQQPTHRLEHDLLGDREVPSHAYYGVHTLRALENFDITGISIAVYPDLIRALAQIKQAAAQANRQLGLLDARRGVLRRLACRLARVVLARERAGEHERELVGIARAGVMPGRARQAQQPRFAVQQPRHVGAAVALAQQQPASLSAQQKTLQQYQQLETLTAELRARNASPQELQAMRTQLVGAEAASRLEALDQETASWNQRVSQYLSARQQILQQNASNPAAQAQQIEALRQQMGFDAEAQKRLPTFEAHPELLKP